MASDSPRNKFAPPNAHAVGRADDASATITQEEAWAAIIGPSNTHGYLYWTCTTVDLRLYAPRTCRRLAGDRH
jgi:hypothetical protein